MSSAIDSTPAADGFRMPGEFEPHAGCWMAWPERPDNWRLDAGPAQAAFAAVAEAIAVSEPVTMAASAAQLERCRSLLSPAVRVVEDRDRRRLDARHRSDLRRRRHRRPARASTGASTPGDEDLLPLGPRRTASPPGPGDRRCRALPRAAGARGRLDPRRRRGHGADDRRVPAQPQPQPGAESGARSSGRCSTTSAPRRSSGSARASSRTRPTGTSTTSPASPARASSS